MRSSQGDTLIALFWDKELRQLVRLITLSCSAADLELSLANSQHPSLVLYYISRLPLCARPVPKYSSPPPSSRTMNPSSTHRSHVIFSTRLKRNLRNAINRVRVPLDIIPALQTDSSPKSRHRKPMRYLNILWPQIQSQSITFCQWVDREISQSERIRIELSHKYYFCRNSPRSTIQLNQLHAIHCGLTNRRRKNYWFTHPRSTDAEETREPRLHQQHLHPIQIF